MRIVAFPRDVVEADGVAKLQAHRVRDETGEKVLSEDLARHPSTELLTSPEVVHLVGAVKSVQKVRNPPGSPFGQRYPDGGEDLEHPGPDEIRGSLTDVHRLEGDHDVHRRIRSGDREV